MQLNQKTLEMFLETPYTPGLVEFVHGPMKSQKTKAIQDKFLQFSDFEFVAFKPDIFANKAPLIKSRDYDWGIQCHHIPLDKPQEMISYVNSKTKLIIIDEATFYQAEKVYQTVEYLSQCAPEAHILLSGLDRDFRKIYFPAFNYLLAIANKDYSLIARCDHSPDCYHPALFSQRLINGKPAHYDEPINSVEDEKSTEKYEARCKYHHQVPGKPLDFDL